MNAHLHRVAVVARRRCYDSFSCVCPAAYSGPLCETDIAECASEPCQHLAGVSRIERIHLQLVAGWSGVLCESDINECSSLPCQNGGLCHDGLNSFTCSCPAGWSGVLCMTNINECSSQPCANLGTCVDGVADSFLCLCPAGYSGLRCESNMFVLLV